MIQFNNLIIEIENQKSLCFFLISECIFTIGSGSCIWRPWNALPERCLDEKHGLANLNAQCCLLKAKTLYQLGYVPN